MSYLSKMCVSTHEYHLMLGKKLISQLEITEKSCHYPPPPTEPRRLLEIAEKLCYYPPPPLNRVGSRRSRKNSATTPPPTESRRFLEITEKTQEIQQPQLGSSGFILVKYGGCNIMDLHRKVLPPGGQQTRMLI